MRRHAGSRKLTHDEGVELVVGLALSFELGELCPIERRYIVAVMHDQNLRIVGCVHRLGLAVIELLPFFHGCPSDEFAPAKTLFLIGHADPCDIAVERPGERCAGELGTIVLPA